MPQLILACLLQVGDASLASLRHQLHLRVLRLDLCSSITDDGFAHLQGADAPPPPFRGGPSDRSVLQMFATPRHPLAIPLCRFFAGLSRLRELSLKGCDNLTWVSVRCISGASAVVTHMRAELQTRVLHMRTMRLTQPAGHMILGLVCSPSSWPSCWSELMAGRCSVSQGCGSWRSSAWSSAATSVPCDTSHVRRGFLGFANVLSGPHTQADLRFSFPCRATLQCTRDTVGTWNAATAGLTKMKRLNLGWCSRLDDAELAHVTRLPALTSLELARTKVYSMHTHPAGNAGMRRW